MTTKALRVQVDAVRPILDKYGLHWELRQGGKHPKIRVEGPDGSQHAIVLSGSPRSEVENAGDWARQDCNGLIRLLKDRHGLKNPPPPPPAPKLSPEVREALMRETPPPAPRPVEEVLVLQFPDITEEMIEDAARSLGRTMGEDEEEWPLWADHAEAVLEAVRDGRHWRE